jgi:hypothetical protein
MKGCIAKDLDGDLFLVPQHGKRVQLSSSADIGSHVGQQVKLSGAFVDADERDTHESASSGKGGTSSSSSKPHTVREFRVLKLDVLSSTCAPEVSKKKR